MALSEIEMQRCKKSLERFLEQRRPPKHLRDQVDMGYRITGQSVVIFEVRPDWLDSSRRMERPFAKATFVRTKSLWMIFWMRRDLKWHGYEPAAAAESFEDFLDVVNRDEYHCFFG